MDSSYDSDSAYENRRVLLYELSEMAEQTLNKLSIASVLCPLENSVIIKLEDELNQLKDRVKYLEDDMVNIKRKRWCKWCLQEAVFMTDEKHFYCCTRCEKLDILLSSDEL